MFAHKSTEMIHIRSVQCIDLWETLTSSVVAGNGWEVLSHAWRCAFLLASHHASTLRVLCHSMESCLNCDGVKRLPYATYTDVCGADQRRRCIEDWIKRTDIQRGSTDFPQKVGPPGVCHERSPCTKEPQHPDTNSPYSRAIITIASLVVSHVLFPYQPKSTELPQVGTFPLLFIICFKCQPQSLLISNPQKWYRMVVTKVSS